MALCHGPKPQSESDTSHSGDWQTIEVAWSPSSRPIPFPCQANPPDWGPEQLREAPRLWDSDRSRRRDSWSPPPVQDHARPLTPAFPRLGNLKTYGKLSRKPKAKSNICRQGESNFYASSPLECSGIFPQFPEDISAIKRPRSKSRRFMRGISNELASNGATSPPNKTKDDCGDVLNYLNSPLSSPVLKVTRGISTRVISSKDDCGDVLNHLNSSPSSPVLKVTRGMSTREEEPKPKTPDFIITLDDDDEEEGEIPDYRDFDEGNLGQECLLYKNESVTLYDYQTLSEGEYINDSIINFYLTYLYEENLSPAEKKQIHIFSSHFFSKLTQRPRRDPNDILPQSARRHEQVKKWTKKVDLFTKRLVIIPVCEENHWYLIIISNPGYIKLPKEEQIIQGNPYFLVLDSLGGNHTSDISKLRSYLQFEHLEKHKTRISFGREKMMEIEPEVPQQTNSCDCGVYLLHYVELLFKNPGQFYWSKMKDLKSWFAESEVRHKREFLANLIQELAVKTNSNVGNFPKLKFARKQRSSKQGKKCDVNKSEEETTTGSPQPVPPPTRFSARSANLDIRPVYNERDDKDGEESENAGDSPDENNTEDDESADTDDDIPLSSLRQGKTGNKEMSPRIHTRSLLENLGATSDDEENGPKEETSPKTLATNICLEKKGNLSPDVIIPEDTAKDVDDHLKEESEVAPDPLEIIATEPKGEECSTSPQDQPEETFLSDGELEEVGEKLEKDDKNTSAITLGSSSNEESESDSESWLRAKKSSKKSKKRIRSRRSERKKKRKSEKRKRRRRRDSSSEDSEDFSRRQSDRKKWRDKLKRSPSADLEIQWSSSRRPERTLMNSFRTVQSTGYKSLQVMVEQSDLPRVVTLTEDRPSRHQNGSDPQVTFDQTNLLLQVSDHDSDSSLFATSSLPKKKSKKSHDLEETFYEKPPLRRAVQGETEDEVEELAHIRPRKFRLQRRNP